jgi:hypothetical protein
VRGLSWTASLGRAAWFANRFAHLLADPAVFRTELPAGDVLAYVDATTGGGRGEDEFVILLDATQAVVRVNCDIRTLAAEEHQRIQDQWRCLAGGE